MFLKDLSVYKTGLFTQLCLGLEEHLAMSWYMKYILLARNLAAVIPKNNSDLNTHKTLEM